MGSQAEDSVTETDLNLHDLDAEFLRVDQSEYSSEVTLSGAVFREMIQSFSKLGGDTGTICIGVTKYKVTFSYDGECGNVKRTLRYHDDSEKMPKLNCMEAVAQEFDIRYLEAFAAQTFADTVTIKMSPQTPMMLHI